MLATNVPLRDGIVAIVGCGTMGIGIAIVAARGGRQVILYDGDAERVTQTRREIAAFLTGSVNRGKMSRATADSILMHVGTAASMQDLACCELVIEAIFEDGEAKSVLFERLNDFCHPVTIFATNTSTLSITGLGARSGRPDRFIGLHFCLPAQVMKLVEITPGLRTSADTVSSVLRFCREVGQIAIETKDRPGFILNHFAIPLNNRAIRMVEDGIAKPADIDLALKTALGFPIGPLQLVDLVGLDTQERLCDAIYAATHDPEMACPPLVRRMIAAGWLGKKVGRGFYEYASTGTFGGDHG